MAGCRWSAEEEAALRELYPTKVMAEVVEKLNGRFGNGRTAAAVKNRAQELGLRKAEGCAHKMPRWFWTDEKRAWFRSFVPGHTESEISAEHERIYGTPLTRGQVKSMKGNLGVRSGTHGGRFEKGHESWNKGKTWDEIMPTESQERSRRTCFAKGNMPHNAEGKPLGCERVDCDGYTWVKVAERPSRPDCNDNWKQKSWLVWEEANGRPVPPDTNIVFANGDKSDFRPENLVAVPRALWAVIARNGWGFHDAPSLRSCMLLAELKAKINAAELSPRECRRCGAEFAPRNKGQRTCDACLGRAGA
jgi:hypothetical protein